MRTWNHGRPSMSFLRLRLTQKGRRLRHTSLAVNGNQTHGLSAETRCTQPPQVVDSHLQVTSAIFRVGAMAQHFLAKPQHRTRSSQPCVSELSCGWLGRLCGEPKTICAPSSPRPTTTLGPLCFKRNGPNRTGRNSDLASNPRPLAWCRGTRGRPTSESVTMLLEWISLSRGEKWPIDPRFYLLLTRESAVNFSLSTSLFEEAQKDFPNVTPLPQPDKNALLILAAFFHPVLFSPHLTRVPIHAYGSTSAS